MTSEQIETPQLSSPAAGRGPGPQSVPAAGTLAVLALTWLLASLWVVRQTIAVAGDGSALVTQAALALPALISAGLVAGTAVGLAAVNLAARRVPAVAARIWPGLLVAGSAGTATGLALAGPLLLRFTGPAPATVLWVALAAAAAVGGLLAGVRQRVVIAAGVAGALGVFVVGFVVGLFDGTLLDLFGAGETAESVLTANAWVALTASLAAGSVAGALSYTYLRRCGRDGLRWPAYLAAGAVPGLLGLLGEAVTRLGGAPLFQLVSALSADDRTVLAYLSAARFNRALIVLFAGALVAIILHGRTLRPAPDDDEPAAAEPEPAEPVVERARPEAG